MRLGTALTLDATGAVSPLESRPEHTLLLYTLSKLRPASAASTSTVHAREDQAMAFVSTRDVAYLPSFFTP